MGHTRKDGSHLENVSHLEKRVTLGKMCHAWKSAPHLENRPHLQKEGQTLKMCLTGENKLQLEKCVTLGKMSHTWMSHALKNGSLEKMLTVNLMPN